MCSDKYDTSNKHESIWEAEFAGDGTGDVRAEGRVGNTIGIQCSDFSSLTNVVGKADPGYAYAFIWATPKLYELFGYVGPTTKEEVSADFEKDERFIWNIAPFTYRASKISKDKGIVGRTFQDDYLYDWVMSADGYGSVSYDYGLCSEPEYDSSIEQIGDVYTKRPTNRDNTRKDLCCAKFRREYEPATKKIRT